MFLVSSFNRARFLKESGFYIFQLNHRCFLYLIFCFFLQAVAFTSCWDVLGKACVFSVFLMMFRTNVVEEQKLYVFFCGFEGRLNQ